MSSYRITKERNGWAVSGIKSGLILVTLDHKSAAQERADEQSQVLAAFNELQEARCLLGELASEFF